MSLTTNYLSNKAFFSSYNCNILGVTGTIGSQHSQNYFKQSYNFEIFKIPKAYFENLTYIK